MNTFQRWMSTAIAKDKNRFARAARTTVGMLRQVAGGYRTEGKTRTNPELARRIEIASKGKFTRESLCLACSKCELAKRARG